MGTIADCRFSGLRHLSSRSETSAGVWVPQLQLCHKCLDDGRLRHKIPSNDLVLFEEQYKTDLGYFRGLNNCLNYFGGSLLYL